MYMNLEVSSKFIYICRLKSSSIAKRPEKFVQCIRILTGAHTMRSDISSNLAQQTATQRTHALTSGVDAKTLSGILGHTNVSFTLDTYTHVTPDMQKAASDVVGGFLEQIFGKELKPWQRDASRAPAP